MQFRVPKYLDRESTIAFGLTFKSLAVVGGAALVLFLLWYVIPNKIIFIVIAVLMSGVLFIFNFVKIRGRSVFETLSHSLNFFISPRIYFWKKTQGVQPIKIIKKKKEEKKEQAPLKVAPRSRLHDIHSKLDPGFM